jgi:hypothetical protein
VRRKISFSSNDVLEFIVEKEKKAGNQEPRDLVHVEINVTAYAPFRAVP